MILDNTIIVSENGDDTGIRGDTNRPFRSISRAAAVAQAGDTIIVYPGNYTHGSGSITIKDGQNWIFLGANLSHTVTDSTLFSCAANDWSVSGLLNITGTGYSNPGSNNSIAFAISSATRWSISGVRVGANIGDANGNANGYCGTAFSHGDPSTGNYRDCHARYCVSGFVFAPGAEYCSLSDCSTQYCTTGFYVVGGNNLFTCCHADRCTTGLKLGTGGNHGHGTWSGGTLNHNTTYSIHSDSVTLGFLIIGTHLWADNSTNNRILINASQGIVLQGCQLSSSVQLTGTLPGRNLLQNCYIQVDGVNVTLTDTGTQIANLVIDGCYKSSGAWTSF